MKIIEIESLLQNFEELPKKIKEPTYLELCKYPRRRFEEICSRLLCFYLNPNNEHELGDLFLFSLFKLLAPEKEFHFKNEKIHVISEENAEGKRLDILVYSNTFVVGIENKIEAPLYNPLETYKNRIQLYGNDNIYRVVLSLRELTGPVDKDFLVTNGFTNLTYKEYFEEINKNLPSYTPNGNPKYLYSLNDFIETIKNMNENNILNEELSNYFFDNSEAIDNLITLYNQYVNNTKKLQVQRITDLREKISTKTNNNNWWAWEGWDLGYNQFNSERPQIGIESYFISSKGNPFGTYNIVITAWSLQSWSFYEEKILNAFPNCKLEKEDNRAFLTVEEINNPEDEQILSSLKKYFDYLYNLTNAIN